MTTNNEDFEKWQKENYPDFPPPRSEVWQAAKAESEKEIADIFRLLDKANADHLEAYTASQTKLDEAEVKVLALQAHINRLREALEAIVNSARDKNCGLRIADEALASTPAQSLADFEDEVLERCAKVCDTSDKSTHPSELADAIREMKVE